MGGWIGIATTVIGAALLFSLGHPWFGGAALGIAVLQFWSFGIMHNYAYEPVARHMRALDELRKDGFPEADAKMLEAIKPEPNPMLAPNWVTVLNLLATLVGAGLFVVALVLWVMK
ncbi:MAG: hypothetical protein HY718_06390 [Planctomycetes bacterium]|nr:hypothetical protein [Planctomycetota bacterium]